ncbi:MAG TPA: HEAT repeat domain-containing protein, partial [Terriglobales bacterium]|nr:HEAT repeat domain-containing protein [Terriglobales bacterium]
LPSPPPQAVPLLVRFVRRTDREPLAQVRAIFTLIATAPSSNEVVACITDFLHRTRSVQTQVDVLNALGNPRVSDERLLDAISQALGSPDEQVRRTAIEVIGRIGPSAVRKSKNRLEAVAADNSETSNVRAAAVKVLKEIR